MQKRRVRKLFSTNATLLFVLAFACTFVLDGWPYASLDPLPYHNPHSWITWTRLGLLSILGVFIPLVEPRTPVIEHDELIDAEMARVTAIEDSASILSRITFGFMDYVIYYAYLTKDVMLADLPEVPSKQRAMYLARRAFKVSS